jgi:hypothetical protein
VRPNLEPVAGEWPHGSLGRSGAAYSSSPSWPTSAGGAQRAARAERRAARRYAGSAATARARAATTMTSTAASSPMAVVSSTRW